MNRTERINQIAQALISKYKGVFAWAKDYRFWVKKSGLRWVTCNGYEIHRAVIEELINNGFFTHAAIVKVKNLIKKGRLCQNGKIVR